MQVRGVSSTLQLPWLQEAPEGIFSLGVEHRIVILWREFGAKGASRMLVSRAGQ